MIVIGLTGSIGMGKSTTARFFAEAGAPVYDSDAIVHALYQGEAAPLVEAAFAGTTLNGKVDRDKLAARVIGDEPALKTLEAIVHPLARAAAARFIADHEARGTPVVVLDVPLLFETAAEGRVDMVVVVTAPPELQRARAFERPAMTEEKFRGLLAKQMPDAEKRKRADFIVDTSKGFDTARARVREILQAAAGMPGRRR